MARTFGAGTVALVLYARPIVVASGDYIPRKCGPGITTADLFVINKTDLAPHVGADLDTMAVDAKRQRGDLPVIFTSLTAGGGIREVADWVTVHLTRWRGEATA
ncbi:hypothetical protein OG331_06080 [Streptomyces sp. NBC_01017]|uniref:GTP-binding protein n=1 Tax=Streptomyces sp. NBC_01017 TaxID=2903721 RepID=UPI00386A5FB8|nr:hypothetical protein OG331_06080 [Streptomyces sp. NBC_01017]